MTGAEGEETASVSERQAEKTAAPSRADIAALSKPKESQLELNESEERLLVQLQQRDVEVRAHEAAHAGAGGALAGAPSYSYRTGPDGKRYATGGQVNIDTSPIQGNPEATIRKMEQVRQAALAPADPSGQDQRVASAASEWRLPQRQSSPRRSSS